MPGRDPWGAREVVAVLLGAALFVFFAGAVLTRVVALMTAGEGAAAVMTNAEVVGAWKEVLLSALGGLLVWLGARPNA